MIVPMKRIMLGFSLLLLAGLAFPQDVAKKLDTLLNAYTSQYKFNGVVLVARGEKILLEKGYGYKDYAKRKLNDPKGVFQVGSITKQFTATVILHLQEEGKLSVQDKLSKYLPDFPSGSKITIENLLTHTSGIYNYTDDNKFINNESLQHVELSKMISMMKSKPLLFTPGSKFSYSNFESLASIYLGAAASSPVRTSPQLPCVSIKRSFCPIFTSASPIEASPCG